MLFQNIGAQRYRRGSGQGTHGMVGKSDGNSEFLFHVADGAKVHIRRVRRINTGAFKQGKLTVARGKNGFHRFLHFPEGCHTG